MIFIIFIKKGIISYHCHRPSGAEGGYLLSSSSSSSSSLRTIKVIFVTLITNKLNLHHTDLMKLIQPASFVREIHDDEDYLPTYPIFHHTYGD